MESPLLNGSWEGVSPDYVLLGSSVEIVVGSGQRRRSTRPASAPVNAPASMAGTPFTST
jgi:hypothetical protein